MRWVVLTDEYPPAIGGVATWTGWAVDALCESGTVEVFARQRPDLVGAVGVRGRSFGRWGGWHLARAALGALQRADAVLATTWPMATGAVHLLPRATPLHVVLHGSDITTGRPTRAFRRVSARAELWAVSRYLAERARRWGASARVLPVPIPQQEPVHGGGDWLFVGRALREKGGDRFVRLCAAARRTGHVVGDGPERARWEALATRLGADVRFWGPLDRARVARSYLDAERVFLLPRTRADGGAEGLGLTLLEAAARGIPTVGTAVGGVPEAAALVLERPDDPEHAVAQIAADDEGVGRQEWMRRCHGPRAFSAALGSGSADIVE